jgi:hypothetical protein
LLPPFRVAWKLKPGGKQRQADPADVRRLLQGADQVRRGGLAAD